MSESPEFYDALKELRDSLREHIKRLRVKAASMSASERRSDS
jgi:hypothetical protein